MDHPLYTTLLVLAFGCASPEPSTDGQVFLTPESVSVYQESLVSLVQSTVSADPVDSVSADGVMASLITVTLRDENGAPLEGIQPDIEVSGSSNELILHSVATDTEGVLQADLTSLMAEEKTISVLVEIEGQLVSLDANATVTFIPSSGGGTPVTPPSAVTNLRVANYDATAIGTTKTDCSFDITWGHPATDPDGAGVTYEYCKKQTAPSSIDFGCTLFTSSVTSRPEGQFVTAPDSSTFEYKVTAKKGAARGPSSSVSASCGRAI